MSNKINTTQNSDAHNDSFNIESDFFEKAKRNNQQIKVYLKGGTCLFGFIGGYDDYVIKLATNSTTLIIYRRAILSIVKERNYIKNLHEASPQSPDKKGKDDLQ